jgi:hypothetical protein
MDEIDRENREMLENVQAKIRPEQRQQAKRGNAGAARNGIGAEADAGVNRFIKAARVIGQDDPLDGPQWIIPGVLQERQTAMLPGPPTGGKSFTILDWCARVVCNVPFLGDPVLPGGCVYVTGEGQGGLAKRAAAVEAEFKMSATDPFLYMSVMPRLLDDQEVKDFIAAVKQLTAHWTVPIRIIAFDTLNRAMVGGNENEGKDVAKVLDADNRIKEAFGCATMYAHHPGKAEGNFSRGHSSLQGNPDVIAAFSGKSGTRTIEIKKQKDDEDGNVISFLLRQVTLGAHAKTGKPVTSCVVDWSEGPSVKASTKQWSKGLNFLRDMITTAIVEQGIDHSVRGSGPLVKAVDANHVRALHNKHFVSNGGNRQEAERKAYGRNMRIAHSERLIAGETITNKNGNELELIWLVKGS